MWQADAVTLGGGARRCTVSNGYVLVAQPPREHAADHRFALPETELVLHHRTRDIRVRLRGEQAVAMDNFGADLTFFDPME